jgi:spore germination protein YaaH
MRRITALLAAATTVLAPAAGILAPAAPAASPVTTTDAAAPKCATSATALAFSRSARSKVARLSWKAPASPKGKLTYRVYKNAKRVAQTHSRSVRVAVTVRHRYRFSVAVLRAGKVQAGPCRLVRTLSVRFLAPTRPRSLKVTVTKGRAMLKWKKSRAGDGRMVGYRVFRDAKTVRQLKGTKLSVPVSADNTTTLSVRSVDSRGHMSAAATSTVAAGGEVPQAPQALRTVSVSDSAVTLAWNASKAGSGRVIGYRVFRDGKTLGQNAPTQLDVPRLNTAQAYTFTVVAVDNRGRLSPPSKALTISTNPPVPSTGTLHAFLLASTGSSFEDFKAHYRQIGAIHVTYFECNRATAAVKGKDDPQITQFAKLRQVEVYGRFDCQSTAILHTILTDPATRSAWLTTMVDTAVQNGYDGINLDFEAGAAADRGAFSSFVAELSGRLHAVGKKLAVDVSPKAADSLTHPRSGIYDYPVLADSADVIFVMAWGIHWSTSAPGPIADMPWLQSVVGYLNTLPNREKYVIGTPMYGMDWANGGGAANPATALEWSDMSALAARVGAVPTYDPTAHEMHFSYADGAGSHEVWSSNAATVLERMQMFRANGYALGVWRLGHEDQAMWSDPLLAG